MRSLENIEEVEIDENTYSVVDIIDYDNNKYIFLINKTDNEDIRCLKAELNDKLELRKLDTDEELNKVMILFFEKHKQELEN